MRKIYFSYDQFDLNGVKIEDASFTKVLDDDASYAPILEMVAKLLVAMDYELPDGVLDFYQPEGYDEPNDEKPKLSLVVSNDERYDGGKESQSDAESSGDS